MANNTFVNELERCCSQYVDKRIIETACNILKEKQLVDSDFNDILLLIALACEKHYKYGYKTGRQNYTSLSRKGDNIQTVQDFAKSKNVSKPIVDTWVYRHGLPVIRIGRRVYIEEDDYIQWIHTHRRVMNDPNEEKTQDIIPKQLKKSKISGKMRKIY